jgi:hypothetical protein
MCLFVAGSPEIMEPEVAKANKEKIKKKRDDEAERTKAGFRADAAAASSQAGL